jgi:hypothetical protein
LLKLGEITKPIPIDMQATKPTWNLWKYKLMFYRNILAKGATVT